jgi:hypothetical protein
MALDPLFRRDSFKGILRSQILSHGDLPSWQTT